MPALRGIAESEAMQPRTLTTTQALALAGAIPHAATAVALPNTAPNWAAPLLSTLHDLSALHRSGVHTSLRPYLTADSVGEPIETVLAVSAGTARFAGVERTYPGNTAAVASLPDDATTRVWAQPGPGADDLAIGHGLDWPGTVHLPLCTVTRTAGILSEPDRTPLWSRLLDADLAPASPHPVAAAVPDAADPADLTDTRDQLNALLASLRAAGILAA